MPHINPIPLKARSFQGLRAGVVTRTIAGAIDYSVIVGLTFGSYATVAVFKFLLDPRDYQLPQWRFGVFLVLGFSYFVLYLTLAFATNGRTLGGRLLGLRVVGRKGTKVPWGTALLRALFCVAVPVGLFWCAVSRENRSIQDVVLRTSVIHDWPVHVAAPTITDVESRSEL
jgi:uncharacterized RDD family membrane protein YckC